MPLPNLDAERHFETIAQCAQDGILTVDSDMTIHYANPAIEHIFDYPPDQLIGSSLTVLLTENQAAEVQEWFGQYPQNKSHTPDWSDVRLQGQHRNGNEIPLSVSFSDFEQDGKQFVTGIVRDVTDQKRREAQLTGLNHLAQDLTEAESANEVCQRAISNTVTILDHPVAAIKLYDSNKGVLEPTAVHTDSLKVSRESLILSPERSLPWTVFVSQEEKVIQDLLDETSLNPDDTPLRSVLIQPISTHGVFIIGATEEQAFTEEDGHIANILTGNVHSALERVERVEALRKQKNELQEKTKSLDRIRRVNEVIRDLTKALTSASDREEITAEVCSRLASADPYRFAWFGSLDPATDEVVPEASAGVENGYLDEITVRVTDEGSTTGLIERAIQTRSPQVQNDIFQDPPFEPWQQAAIEREYRASIAVPVRYQDTLYGVLNLYASEAGVFEQLEIAVLQELGEMIGYALNSEERKQAFTSERSVELAFEVDGCEDSLLGLGEQTNGQFELENLVERRDESATMFFAAHGQTPDEAIEWANGQSQIRDLRLLTDREDECLFECTLDSSTIWAQLLQRGSIVRSAISTPDFSKIVIRIPHSGDARSFDALLEEHFTTAELVARREYEEPVMTPEEFEAEFRERLTERQDEVLQTAYYAGYFERPRQVNAGELADILGIAQPTVSRHLRSGKEKFLSMVYDEP